MSFRFESQLNPTRPSFASKRTLRTALESRGHVTEYSAPQWGQKKVLGIAPATVELGKEALPTLSR